MRPTRFTTAAALALAAVMLAACSSGGSAAPATSSAAGPVTLTFWSWVPGIDKVVATWNAAHPNITVNVSKPAQGDPLIAKILAADKAGNPPDLMQAEYQALPGLVTNGVAADITGLTSGASAAFSTNTWNLVTFSGKRYGIPQDVGPMMLYYRQDLFQQYGLKVPATWDDFAADAKLLRTKTTKSYLTTFSSGDAGWFAGLAAQAGAKWWSFDGKSWAVNVNDAATKKVADYWNGLLAAKAIAGNPMYTPEWNKQMNDGTLLAWPSAVWGPGVLQGIAPATKGKWAMVPLPQWQAGQSVTGFWGGSSTAIAAKSKHQAQAVQFAQWLNTDPAALQAMVVNGGIYPAATAGQSVPALQQAPAVMPNQPDFYTVAKQISATAVGFTWGPDVNVTYSTYNDATAKAIQSQGSLSAAVDAMQAATVADMKKSGFTLSNGG